MSGGARGRRSSVAAWVRFLAIGATATVLLVAIATLVMHHTRRASFVAMRAIVHEAHLELAPPREIGGALRPLLGDGLRLRTLSWRGVQEVERGDGATEPTDGANAAGAGSFEICPSAAEFSFTLLAQGPVDLGVRRVRRDRVHLDLLGPGGTDRRALLGTLSSEHGVQVASQGLALPPAWASERGCRSVSPNAAPLRLRSAGPAPALSLEVELPEAAPEADVVVLDAHELDGPDVVRRLRLPLPDGRPLPSGGRLVFLDREAPEGEAGALFQLPMEISALRLWTHERGLPRSFLVAARVEFPNGEADPITVARNGLITLRPSDASPLILRRFQLGDRGIELEVEGEATELLVGFGRTRQALPTALQAFYADRPLVWLTGTLLSALVALLTLVFGFWKDLTIGTPDVAEAREELSRPSPPRRESPYEQEGEAIDGERSPP